MADMFGENGSGEEKEESFAELFELYDTEMSHDIAQGDKIDGTIISIGENSVYVSTGTKSDGVVEKAELFDENGDFPYVVGDKLSLYVVSRTESEIILSKALSGAATASLLEETAFNRTPVVGKVQEVIKGGFSVDVMGKRAFCPISKIDIKYVETPEDYVGKVLNFIITRFSESGRNIVVSRRELLEREMKELRQEFLKGIKEGDVLEGEVIKVMPYGAFIQLSPGVEGMAHISELGWSRVEKVEEILSQGDMVQTKILKIEEKEDKDAPKISLSLKQVSADPWESVDQFITTGQQVSGKVVRLAPFGAFVEIVPGMDGLVHLSEMSYVKRVVKAEDEVSLGEMIQVVVKDIDRENKRISLSMKDAHGDPWNGVSDRYIPGTIVDGHVEKREKFGLFITLEAGVTGLLPGSVINRSSSPQTYEKLKPGDAVKVMVETVNEDDRRISLAPPEVKETDNWKKFAGGNKTDKTPENNQIGSMGALLMEAMNRQAKEKKTK